MTPEAPAVLLDEPQARRQLGGIGRSTFYALIGSGELRSVKIGRRRFVPAAAIREYVACLERAQGHAAA